MPTLIAVLLDTEATITDQILEMYDRIVGRMFNEAKRKHEQSFTESGKAINEKVRLCVRVGHALIDARQKGLDPYAAIRLDLVYAESVINQNPYRRPLRVL